MFREAVFDVGDLVRPGENTLTLRFDRPLDHVGEEHPDQWGRNAERVSMRTRWDADRASGALDRYLSVSSDHDRFRSNRYFFGAIKDLRRDPFKPKVDITPIGAHELSVRLEAPAYTYFVHLEVPDEATRFSDNYFDLEPGQQRTISITNEKRDLEPENVKTRWR